MSKTAFAKSVLPASAFKFARDRLWWTTNRLADAFGQTMTKRGDFSSPVPDVAALARHRDRWDRPSRLVGVRYDLPAMEKRLDGLLQAYRAELAALPDPAAVKEQMYGWGYPAFDAQLLYMMLRDVKPRRLIEVGSGMSTVYARLAAERNAADGRPMQITCVEPYPTDKLRAMSGVDLRVSEVQDVPPEFFGGLDDGDVLFIDSSHVLKIDSDVSHLYLEVLPALAQGVYVHCHDVPFPRNTPHPSQLWVLNDYDWKMFWTEAMLLQAFLCFNDAFEIVLSTPMIRHFDEPFLRDRLADYRGIDQEPNTFSSLWMRRGALKA